MRRFKLFTPYILLTLFGCKSTSFFNAANDFTDKDCTVFLLNGAEKNGKLTVQFETGHSSNNTIHIKTVNNEEEKILIDSIRFYKIGKDFFYPKEINLESFEIQYKNNLYLPNASNILFVKRLTQENARINFFELFQSKNKTNDGNDHFYYLVSFNNQNRMSAANMGSNLFFQSLVKK
ncbi:MAG: hypothetical protein ABIS01_07880 [Ferruginibacter sp.]